MADAPHPDILWAVRTLTARADAYQTYADYYAGNHRLAFASKKFRNAFGETLKAFANNRCPAVVDAYANRLKVVGFGDEGDGGGQSRAAAAAAAVWRENRMDRRQGEVHQELLVCGDAYVVVWPDPLSGRPRLYPNDAAQVAVRYDPERPGTVALAAKAWRDDDGGWRLNLYYPDRLEKYRSVGGGKQLPVGERRYEPYQPPEDAAWPVPYAWDFPQVPVFHFAHRAKTGQPGRSLLADVVPLQDALNKAICDMLVAMEFAAFRQRWATGLEVETAIDPATGQEVPVAPFQPGVDRLWTTENEAAKFGEFEAADLGAFLAVQDSFDVKIARASQVPLYWVVPSGTPPSGESLKTADASFVAAAEHLQVAIGNDWEDVLGFCARLLGAEAGQLTAQWKPAESRSDQEFWTVAQLKEAVGVPPEQLQREAGYSEDQIAKFAAAAARQAQRERAIGAALATSFSRGAFGPDGGNG